MTKTVAFSRSVVAGGERRPTSTIVLIAGVVAVVLVAFASRYGYHRDELYFLAAGRHLDWAYADQGLLTPLLARAMNGIAPNSLLLLRLPSALAAGITVLLNGLLAREWAATGEPRRCRPPAPGPPSSCSSPATCCSRSCSSAHPSPRCGRRPGELFAIPTSGTSGPWPGPGLCSPPCSWRRAASPITWLASSSSAPARCRSNDGRGPGASTSGGPWW